ncbi:cupin domain-containing protein [Enterococcus sp. LJL98]
MGTNYQYVQAQTRVPVDMALEAIEGYPLHRHKQLEILFVLEGSINVRVEEEGFRLEENDLVVINRYELHGVFGTSEKNAVLKFQIDTDFYNYYFPNYSKKKFNCNATYFSRTEVLAKEGPFEKIRQQLATLAYQWRKKKPGYQLDMGTALLNLGKILVRYFEDDTGETRNRSRDLERLSRILDYIDRNFEKGVSLKEIAELEQLNFYYLSTFIKQNLGVSFQEYVNMRRIEKVMDQLVTSEKKITDIAFESGFSTTKSMNQLFKRLLKMTPTAFREKYQDDHEGLSKLDPFGLRTKAAFPKPENYHELIQKLYTHL